MKSTTLRLQDNAVKKGPSLHTKLICIISRVKLVGSFEHLCLKYNGLNVIGYLFLMYKPTFHY